MPNQEPRQFTYKYLKTDSGQGFVVILVVEEEAMKPGGIDYIRSMFSDFPFPLVIATHPEDEPLSDGVFRFFGDSSLTEVARSKIGAQTEWREASVPALRRGDSVN